VFFRGGRQSWEPALTELYRLFEGTQQRIDPVRCFVGENFCCILPRVVQPGNLVFSWHLSPANLLLRAIGLIGRQAASNLTVALSSLRI
jgi:hypothetical protein